MRIGILVLSVGSSGQRKFYNLQEIGLAKALDAYCEKVRVWRLVPHGEDACSEKIAGYKNVTIEFLPSRCSGTNGFMDCSKLDRDLDALICFADTQVTVPMIYRWAKRNKVLFLPYIGVAQSHSTKENLLVTTLLVCLPCRPTVSILQQFLKGVDAVPTVLTVDHKKSTKYIPPNEYDV